MSAQPSCPCDDFTHPEPVSIDAGLSTIPRQIATFGEFRRAMLAALPAHAALADWRARGDQDLGVMLLEMWAYACDVLSFYDETIAHESYLRTARLLPSVRKLVALVGYRPRPAVAARARLAVQADGRQPVVLPAGLAFRSSAFGSESPQVYELDADTRVHPLLNSWPLSRTRPSTIPAGSSRVLLDPRDARVVTGDHLLVQSGGGLAGGVFTATAVNRVTGSDGDSYVAVNLDSGLPGTLPLASARLLRPAGRTALWTDARDPQVLAPKVTTLALAGVVPQVRAGGWIIASSASARAAFLVTTVTQGTRLIADGSSFMIGSTSVTTPPLRSPQTTLTISPGWQASLGTEPGRVVIEYNLQDAGTLRVAQDRLIATAAPLVSAGPGRGAAGWHGAGQLPGRGR